MKNNFRNSVGAIVLIALLFVLGSCNKSYLETNPTDQISKEDVFKTTTSAYTALNGLNRLMVVSDASSATDGYHDDFGQKEFDLVDDLMGNDMVLLYDNGWFWFYYEYLMQESGSNFGGYQIWYYYYRIINNANNIIDNIDNAEGPDEEKNDIKGQALAYRAWAYSRLVNYFQHTYKINGGSSLPGVPLYLHATDPKTNGEARGTLQDDYNQIVSDIEESINLLGDIGGITHDKSSISLYVAEGIYARIALVMQNWEKADEMAYRALQGNAGYIMNTDEYKSGFNSNTNGEWMWASTLSSTQSNDMSIVSFMSFMDPRTPGYASIGGVKAITKQLYNQIPDGDVRKEIFQLDGGTNLYLQKKFWVVNPDGFVFDNLYMRSSEMYLIRAEAKVQEGDVATAKDLLETLIKVRNPSYTAPSGSTALLNEIYLQRRIELWGEGFAYSDLVRLQRPLQRPSGVGNHTSGANKFNLPVNSDQFVFKIPQRELDLNPNIGPEDQNP